jgi:uncharacterized heparinase superfamily protein
VGKTPDGKLFVEAWHDGYKRLKGRPIHGRRIDLSKDGMSCIDKVCGVRERAVAYFHCHPSVQLATETSTRGFFTLGADRRLDWVVDGGQAAVIGGQWHPEFGLSESSETLKVRFAKSGESVFSLSWNPFGAQ